MASAPAATAARRSASKRKSSGDTIEVKQRIAAFSLSDHSDGETGIRRSGRRSSARHASTTEPNRPWGREGKAPAPARVTELDVVNSDDAVEEYQFSSDEDMNEAEDELDDDARSVISLSSASSVDSGLNLSERPWANFSTVAREQWEIMYSTVNRLPIGTGWDQTEDYQREKDAEMLRYMEDFPLNQWIIPQEEANKAYFRLLERTRWRSLGIRIYGRDPLPEWTPGSASDAMKPQTPLEVSRERNPRGPPYNASHSERPPPPSSAPVTSQPSAPATGEASRGNAPAVPPHTGPPRPGEQNRHAPMQHPPMLSHNQPTQHSAHALPHHPGQHPQYPPMHYAGPPAGHPPGHPGHHPVPQGYPGPPGPFPPGQYPPPHPHGLPSQSYAHPMPGPHVRPPPPGMGRPIGPPQQMPYGMPPSYPPPHMMQSGPYIHPPAPKPRRGKEKRETPVHATPPPPPETPPYPTRQKPIEKKILVNKNGRKNARRQAEADEYPWARKLDFKEAKEKATWDDSVYDAQSLARMDATRNGNIPVIDELDAKVQEQQRMARAAKKNKDKLGENFESSEPEGGREKKKKQRGQRQVENSSDPYHSGAYAFVSAEDTKKALDLGYKSPDEALDAGEAGKLAPDVQATINIYWNPGKKGVTEGLQQITFTVKDTLVTRKQIIATPVLTTRAADCVIDFCPDMLWRGMLLRICSEAGYGNKDVRDRFCYNGCYCDKATITKRISAALGQKQVQPKSKGYGPGEWEWYDENVKNFAKYIDFFGKRTSHRNMLKIQMQGEKRKAKMQEEADTRADEAGSSDDNKAGPSKRTKSENDNDDEVQDSEGGDDAEDGHESDGTDDSNAVSVQDSDILDKMED